MVLNYKFENFLSFRDEVEFSMLAPKTKVKNRFPNNYISAENGSEILKTAVIVGENAGGKSNFVRSLDYFKSLFKDNEARTFKGLININNIEGNCPRCFNTCSKFEIEVLVNGDCFYLYHLEIDFTGIVKEVLSYKKGYKQKYQQILSVSRTELDYKCNEAECKESSRCKPSTSGTYELQIEEFDSDLEEPLKNATQNQKNIGLFITKLAILGSEHAIRFTEWIKHNLCPETNVINYDLYKSMRNEEEDLRILNDARYLEIFRMIDYSIREIKVDEEKPFSKTLVIRKKKDGSIFSRELGRDSSGVRVFFAWAVQIFKVVYENTVVFADEMDGVLNPVLSDRVIAFINGKKHYGQFIFTTHNVLHLNLKNYMKEQIYFITKDAENLESELYSLADFPEIRYETTKIYEFYMKGILGGTAVE